jgi:quinolinate synthase
MAALHCTAPAPARPSAVGGGSGGSHARACPPSASGRLAVAPAPLARRAAGPAARPVRPLTVPAALEAAVQVRCCFVWTARLVLHWGPRPCRFVFLAAPAAAERGAPSLSPRPALTPFPPPTPKPSQAPSAAFRARLAAALGDASASSNPKALSAALLAAAASAPPFPPSDRTPEHRVPGCAAATWVTASISARSGTLACAADSEAALSKGVAVALATALSGLTPAEALSLTASDLAAAGLPADALLSTSRTGGPAAVLASLQARVRAALDGGGGPAPFPSLVIGAGGRLEPRGAYAQAQARFLKPDAATVADLASLLSSKRMGVVAHFYMDPEVQGVLAAAASAWPHIRISDSLAMADAAVGMARAGCEAIAVLGVDFMSENVRAILDSAGFADVAVVRMSSASIGCTLADAADAPGYGAWLEAGAEAAGAAGAPALHVVYINTSLRSKARAHAAVPTITCTSSNVVSTVLAAFAAVPDLRVLYGPDSYMGANLATLLESVASLGDAAAASLHPAHTAASLRSARERLTYFADGTCAVHHLFGGGVARTVGARYGDALLAAHFEVPGELFGLALAASRPESSPGGRPRGVVGSTQNILDFITARLDDALADAADRVEGGSGADAPSTSTPERLRVVLGTETGMVTSIVRAVSARLEAAPPGVREAVEVEVIFPVSDEAVTAAPSASSSSSTLPGGLAVIPGPAGGEGCSASGGCAACPYMKMNTLAALRAAAAAVGEAGGAGLLAAQAAARHADALVEAGGGAKTVAEVGCAPILHMRAFQREGALPADLLADIQARRRSK